MKRKRNLTVQLEEDVIRKARVLAAERGTSVSGLVAEEIERLAGEREAYEMAKHDALDLLRGARPRGGRRWKRDELHDRASLR